MTGLLASIRARWSMALILTVGMVLVITLLMALVIFMDIRRERSVFRDTFEQKGRLLAVGMHDILGNYLYFSDIDALGDVSERVIESQSEVTHFQIFDIDGKRLAGTIRAGYQEDLASNSSSTGTGEDTSAEARFQGDTFNVSNPIGVGAQPLGSVQIGFSTEPLSDEIREIILQHVWQGLALLALGIILAYLVARYATRPLEALTAAATEIGRGKLDSDVPIRGTKETAQLGGALDHMRVELRNLYSGLGRLVEERTEELSSTNEELKNEIAERTRAEEALRQAEEKFRGIIEHSVQGFYQTTPDGRFLAANPAMAHIYGYDSPEELIANLTDMDHQLYVQPGRRAEFGRQVDELDVMTNVENELYRKDGSIIWTSESVRAVRDDRGAVIYYEGTVVDISKRKHAEKERENLLQEVPASRERLQALSRQLVEVQEAERRHIARELHDEIGQILTGLKLTLEMETNSSHDGVAAKLARARGLVDGLMDRVREMSLELRPAMLDDLGLLPALLWYIQLYTSQTNVNVAFSHDGLDRRFSPEVETAAFRIVQEALTNVARHAQVAKASVRLSPTRRSLGVLIQDRGVGFHPETALAANNSSGLAGIRERADLLGGRFMLNSAPGAGTSLTARLPLNGNINGRKKKVRS